MPASADNIGPGAEQHIEQQSQPDSPMARILAKYDMEEPESDDQQPPPIDQGEGDEPPSDTPVTKPAETPGEQEAAEEEGPKLEDELSHLAGIYGIPADELKDFQSAEEAERALRLISDRYAEAGLAAMQQPPQQYGQQGADVSYQQQPYQPPPVQQQQPPQPAQLPPIDLGDLEPDHPVAKNLQAMHEFVQQQHQQIEQMQQQWQWQQQQAQEREVHQVLQEVNETLEKLNPEIFGTADQQTMFQQNHRMSVLHRAEAIALGMQQQGHRLPSRQQLLEQSYRQLFATDIEKQQRRAAATAQQSRNGARLGRPSAAPAPRDEAAEWDGSFEDNPRLHRLWSEMQMQS